MVRIGDTVVEGGFAPAEVSFNRFPFRAIDYGGKVRIVDLAKRKIRTGDDFEISQCDNLHFPDAAEWH